MNIMIETPTDTPGQGFDSQAPEALLSLALQDQKALEIPYLENPNVVLALKDTSENIPKKARAGLLINEDKSLWLTNLGEDASLEVFRIRNERFKSLKHGQVAYLSDGDLIGFAGKFYQLNFLEKELLLEPHSFEATQSLL